MPAPTTSSSCPPERRTRTPLPGTVDSSTSGISSAPAATVATAAADAGAVGSAGAAAMAGCYSGRSPPHSGVLAPHPEQPSVPGTHFSRRSPPEAYCSAHQPMAPKTMARIAATCIHIAYELPSPAKPMNARLKMPAMRKLIPTCRITLGMVASSFSSRMPAISTSAKVSPAPAPSA